MTRFCLGIVGLLCPAVCLADGYPAQAEQSGCGGDAFTYAEVVVAPQEVQREALIVLPETLCADLQGERQTQINSMNVYLDRPKGLAPRYGEPRRFWPPKEPPVRR